MLPGWRNQMVNDLRYAFRMLRASPLLTLVAVLSIATAVGANTAVFTLVDQLLLRMLPVEDPRRLVQLTTTEEFYGATLGDGTELTYPLYVDLRDNNQVFAGMLCTFPTNLHLSAGGRSERVAAEVVAGSYFAVLGVHAALGRLILESDDRAIGGIRSRCSATRTGGIASAAIPAFSEGASTSTAGRSR